MPGRCYCARKYFCLLFLLSGYFATGAGCGPVKSENALELSPVIALFSSAPNWNDYRAGGGGITNTDDRACDADNDTACSHGGQWRVFEVPGKTDCTNLSASDVLGAFTWVCDSSTGKVRFLSTGLAEGKYLSDLLDFETPGFKPNHVTVHDNGEVFGVTVSSIWWDNPVEVNNEGGILDRNDSTIYLVTENPHAPYTIGESKVGLVIQPGVTLSGAGKSKSVVTAATPDGAETSYDYLWLEGRINASGDENGVLFKSVRFSVVRNLAVEQAGDDGVVVSSSSNNTLSGIALVNNDDDGIALLSGSNNTLSEITTINNGGSGVRLSGSNNTVFGITAANNKLGVLLSTSKNTVVSGITAVNNDFDGVQCFSSSNNALAGIATAYNGFGVSLHSSRNNTLSEITTANNGSFDVFSFESDHNVFTGMLRVDNNGNCDVGIEEGLDSSCRNNGASDAMLIENVTLENTFVGKVTGDDTQNASDTAGAAVSFPSSPDTFDWSSFENRFRGWGKDGPDFSNEDNPNRWKDGAGYIWDWSVSAKDMRAENGTKPAVLGVLAKPNGNDVLAHTWNIPEEHTGGCEALVPGSVLNTIVDDTDGEVDVCQTTFLRNAVEIHNDGAGNDNILCESGETCLYTPNIASYQGHGSLVSAGEFNDGELTNITLVRYEHNGR